jgi:hypothetical protein
MRSEAYWTIEMVRVAIARMAGDNDGAAAHSRRQVSTAAVITNEDVATFQQRTYFP